MWKFIAVLVLTAAAFGLGFYFGQRPAGTLQETAADLQHSLKDTSRNIIDTTMGIERDLRRRQGLIDTKSRVVQAKSELFDKNFWRSRQATRRGGRDVGDCHEGWEARRVDPRPTGTDWNASGSETGIVDGENGIDEDTR